MYKRQAYTRGLGSLACMPAGYRPCHNAAAVVVAIGYDARHGSHQFALDTAAVVTAAGGIAHLMPRDVYKRQRLDTDGAHLDLAIEGFQMLRFHIQ